MRQCNTIPIRFIVIYNKKWKDAMRIASSYTNAIGVIVALAVSPVATKFVLAACPQGCASLNMICVQDGDFDHWTPYPVASRYFNDPWSVANWIPGGPTVSLTKTHYECESCNCSDADEGCTPYCDGYGAGLCEEISAVPVATKNVCVDPSI